MVGNLGDFRVFFGSPVPNGLLFGLVMAVSCFAEKPAVEAEKLRAAPISTEFGKNGFLKGFLSKADQASEPDSWPTEVFSDAAGGQLKLLGKLLEGTETPENASKMAASDFAAAEMRPPGLLLTTAFEDAGALVKRGVCSQALRQDLKGSAALSRVVEELKKGHAADAEIHTKFKIISVEPEAGSTRTSIYVQTQAHAAGKGPATAQTMVWQAVWQVADPPLLKELSVSDYEEVKAEPLFEEATLAVLGKTQAWEHNLSKTLDHWLLQSDSAFQLQFGTHGVSVVDVNGDDREDIFLPQPAGLRNLLFLQQPDGTLVEAGKDSGLNHLDNSRAATFADFDNDGDLDAAVSLSYGVTFYSNDGKGHFTYRLRADISSWTMSYVAGDYDLDGDVDLYLCGYTASDAISNGDALANPIPFHDANNGARNFLLCNDGDWHFHDATEETGLEVNNRRFTLAATWEDYDNDGDADLHVANDYGRKSLYRNDLIVDGKRAARSTFVDVAPQAGVEDIGPGMSSAWGDFNRDGLMDIYVSNMFSSAGRRIAFQKNFRPGENTENLAGFKRHSRGNTLFLNNGDGTFRDVAEETHTVIGRWAWGSLFMDLNNDTWQDIYVCNGMYTRPDPGDL
jgi:hypothetical protein